MGTVLVVQVARELFTEGFYLPSSADSVVFLSNDPGSCFSISLNSTKSAELLVKFKKAEEHSLLREDQPRDMTVIYSIDWTIRSGRKRVEVVPFTADAVLQICRGRIDVRTLL